MAAKRAHRERTDAQVAVLDALVERSEEGMTVLLLELVGVLPCAHTDLPGWKDRSAGGQSVIERHAEQRTQTSLSLVVSATSPTNVRWTM